MEQKQFYTHDEVMDDIFGPKGTPKREEHELNLELFLVGDTIKRIRQSKKLTQEDLGKLIGVQKAQISKIENGRNLTIATILKVFKALGVDAKIHIEGAGVELALS